MRYAAATRGVVVGNPVADEIRRDGVFMQRTVGGTATYASLALRALDLDVTLLGAIGSDHGAVLRAPTEAAGVDTTTLRTLPSPSTSYLLDYRGASGERDARLLAAGPRIQASDIDEGAPVGTAFVHVGPVAGEVSGDVVEALARWHVPMGIDLHSLRRFDREGRVRLCSAADSGLPFGHFDVVKGALSELRAFAPHALSLEHCFVALTALGVKTVLATDGGRGALVHDDGIITFVPAFATHEVDPTGAGDVFLAAFLLARHVRGEAAGRAAAFAAAAASFAVEGPGTSALGTFEGVLDRSRRLTTKEATAAELANFGRLWRS